MQNQNFVQVPSAFFIADCMLRLDLQMCGHLIRPCKGDTKTNKALEEAKRLKKLMGSLRHLFRNSIEVAFYCVNDIPTFIFVFCFAQKKERDSVW